jgi:hypothetical protein
VDGVGQVPEPGTALSQSMNVHTSPEPLIRFHGARSWWTMMWSQSTGMSTFHCAWAGGTRLSTASRKFRNQLTWPQAPLLVDAVDYCKDLLMAIRGALRVLTRHPQAPSLELTCWTATKTYAAKRRRAFRNPRVVNHEL